MYLNMYTRTWLAQVGLCWEWWWVNGAVGFVFVCMSPIFHAVASLSSQAGGILGPFLYACDGCCHCTAAASLWLQGGTAITLPFTIMAEPLLANNVSHIWSFLPLTYTSIWTQVSGFLRDLRGFLKHFLPWIKSSPPPQLHDAVLSLMSFRISPSQISPSISDNNVG